MATNSSVLAWKIPWMEEPGRLYSVRGVAKSWTRLSDFTFTFREGNGKPLQYSCLEFGVWRSLEGYSSWGHKESDTTEHTTHIMEIEFKAVDVTVTLESGYICESIRH